jgi:hypothetical protein
MVHSEAYDGRRVGHERVPKRKEERNKWGFLEGGHDWKGETVYAVVPCSLFRHKPKLVPMINEKK